MIHRLVHQGDAILVRVDNRGSAPAVPILVTEGGAAVAPCPDDDGYFPLDELQMPHEALRTLYIDIDPSIAPGPIPFDMRKFTERAAFVLRGGSGEARVEFREEQMNEWGLLVGVSPTRAPAVV